MTPYGQVNPSIRLFEYDSDTKIPINYVQYNLDLEEANTNGPVVKVEYSALEAYDLVDLSPKSMNELIGRMVANDTLFQQYYQRIYSSYPNPPCNGDCKKGTLCSVANVLPTQQDLCMNSFLLD